MRSFLNSFAFAVFLGLPCLAFAQGTDVALGGLALDAALPVEVTADSLSVDQDTGHATFAGDVVVAQGDMRLSAGSLVVEYDTEQEAGISRMTATGGVTLVNGPDTAAAQEAVYELGVSSLVMTGGVTLTQGRTRITGDRFAIDLTTGAGRMEGRVRTVFQTQDN
ncbi:MAG: lipopolysaccharide transport periplasmic protein LptA [Rhodobacteraceae bacterium]|nr:LptA/OstA family protein [Alphaproteobacteria bacterium]NNK66267.1 lipopolysaccharide transport periplasmic protein LptA [Paracoccaceae bacterium]